MEQCNCVDWIEPVGGITFFIILKLIFVKLDELQQKNVKNIDLCDRFVVKMVFIRWQDLQ